MVMSHTEKMQEDCTLLIFSSMQIPQSVLDLELCLDTLMSFLIRQKFQCIVHSHRMMGKQVGYSLTQMAHFISDAKQVILICADRWCIKANYKPLNLLALNSF